MRTLIGLFASLLITCTVSAADSGAVKIRNELKECLSIEAASSYKHNNLTILRVSKRRRQITAECGCTSRVVQYQVDEIGTDYVQEAVITGEFVERGGAEKLDILLHSDNRDDGQAERRVTFGCG